MPKKKTDAQTIASLTKELRTEVDDAIERVFDGHPNPVLPGGEGWRHALGGDVSDVIKGFAAEMRYDVQQEKKAVAKKTKRR